MTAGMPHSTRPRGSVAWTGSLALMGAITLVLTAFGLLDYQSERQHRAGDLHQCLDAVSRQLSQTLVLPLWDLDVPQVEQLVVSSMENDRNVQAVWVADLRHAGGLAGRTRDKAWRPTAASQPPSGDGLPVLSQPVLHQGVQIGTVSVWGTDRFVHQELMHFLMKRATVILAANTVLALVLWLIFRRTVLLPLREIETYAFRVSQGEEDARPSRRAFPAEIENVRSSIERMVGELTRRYRELSASRDALAAAEERYRDIFENALEGMMQNTLDGRILIANPAMARMLGYDSPEMFIAEVVNLCHLYVNGRDRDQFVELLLGEGRVNGFEALFRRRDGTKVWLASTTELVRNASGQPLYLSGMVQDVTQRRLTEEALRESEEKYRALIESANDAVFVHIIREDGLPGNIVEVNAAACHRLGYSCESFSRMSPAELDAPHSREHIPQVMEQLRQTGAVVFETVHQASDGRGIPVEVSARLVDLRGRAYVFSMARDITERKSAEQALRESEARFRTLFEDAPLPYQSLDEQGMCLDVNRSWLATLGYERQDVLGRWFGEFLGPESVASFVDCFSRFKREGGVGGVEFDMVKKGGGTIRVLLNGSVQRDAQGRLLRTHCIFADITDRKRAEDTLREREGQLRTKLEYLLTSEAGIDMLELSSILNIPAIQSILDVFSELTGAAVGFFEANGKCLAASGWRDICRGFHRVHPDTQKKCVESDTHLNQRLLPGEHAAYRCSNNMWDVVTPIYVGDKHVGNIFTGQFFYEDEEIDSSIFLAQAEQYGFDKEPYMDALARVPRFGREKVESFMDFLVQFANMVSSLGYSNLKLAKALYDQKRVEEALRQKRDKLLANQEKLALAMDMANLAPWEYDYASDTFVFDDRFYALYGTSCAREGGGRMKPETYAREFLFPQDVDLIRQRLASIHLSDASDAGGLFEHRIRRRDGPLRSMVARSVAIRDASGRAVKLIGANQDITEQKQAEVALRESEERYRTLYLNTPVMLHSMDTEGRLVAISDTWAEKMGYAREEVLGRFVMDFITDESKRIAQEVSWPRYYTTGHVEDIPYQFITKHGRLIDVLLTARAERDEAGRIVRSLAVLVDVTERNQAEEALRRSEAKYRTLLDNIPLSIVYKDANSIFLAVNKYYASLFGRKPEDFPGKTDFDFCDNTLAAKFQADDRRIMTIGVAEAFDERHIFSGRECIIHTLKTPIFDERGSIESVLAISWDVTDARRTEAALREAEKMAAMGTLAGGVAHDFNNILSSVANLALLAAQDLPPQTEARQDLEQILESAKVGKELVRQILTFCRPDKEVRRVFDPVPEVAKALKLMKPSFPVEIAIRQELPEGIGVVLADPSQFHQIVLNLCSNAVDAMRGTPGILSVSLGREAVDEGCPLPHPSLEPDNYVTLRVGDTGPGIAPAIMGRIFEPFFTSKPKGRGTGLGLAVVHGIVRRHGGAVTVQSQPGHGSVFSVYLPVCDMDEELPELPAATPVRGTGNLLLVDDDQRQADAGRRLLERLGYKVTVCGDGLEALAVLRQAPEAFDLVMTDLAMHNMDGKALTLEVLALRPDMPIILSTGNSEAFPPDEAHKIGIRDYIPKPVNWNRLSATIAGLLPRKG